MELSTSVHLFLFRKILMPSGFLKSRYIESSRFWKKLSEICNQQKKAQKFGAFLKKIYLFRRIFFSFIRMNIQNFLHTYNYTFLITFFSTGKAAAFFTCSEENELSRNLEWLKNWNILGAFNVRTFVSFSKDFDAFKIFRIKIHWIVKILTKALKFVISKKKAQKIGAFLRLCE